MASLEEQFTQAVDGLESGVNLVSEGFDTLVEAYDSLPDRHPIEAYWLYWSDVRDVLVALGDDIDKIVNRCREFLERSTPVISLFRVAFGWSHDVLGPVSRQEGIAAGSAKSNLANWQGAAAVAYREKRLEQKFAIEATSANAIKIGKFLTDVAKANVDFLLDVIEPLLDIYATLISAIAAAATGIGIAEAIGKAADIAGKLWTGLFKENQAVTNLAVTTLVATLDADHILNNSGKFPGGHWPQADNV
jgi:hypothetical protein